MKCPHHNKTEYTQCPKCNELFTMEHDNDNYCKPCSTTQETTKNYYIENGFTVFTEEFLKQRPCCHNNCRHCPYD